jgi:drug/metabolite transporter (DMT)-like permease
VIRVVCVFLAGTVGIAFAAIFVRAALPAPPVVTGFYRMLFASLVLATLVAARRGASPASRRALLQASVAGLCFGTDLALWHVGLTRTSVANATLLVNTTPLYVGVWSALVLHERLGARFLAGAALALAGAALLLGVEWRGGGSRLQGDALSLGAALFYSGYLLLMKAARREAGAAQAVLAASLAATVVLGLYALALGDPFRGFPARSWAAFAGAALVSQVGGVLAIAWALRHLPATFASVALLAQPTGTALLGWILLGEALSPLQALGGATVLAGIALASQAIPQPTRTPAPPTTGRSPACPDSVAS